MKFSIIVPCYNVGNYIEKTIKSICLQTYSNFEVLLIDDGSTDNTKDIILKAVNGDQRFIYYYQKNSGVSAARNKGLELSRGDYIYFLDGDDAIEPNLLEVAEKHFRSNSDVEMLSFGYKINKN